MQEAGWAPGPVWTGAENLDPTGIRSPDRPARSESIYRLSCPGAVNVRSWDVELGPYRHGVVRVLIAGGRQQRECSGACEM